MRKKKGVYSFLADNARKRKGALANNFSLLVSNGNNNINEIGFREFLCETMKQYKLQFHDTHTFSTGRMITYDAFVKKALTRAGAVLLLKMRDCNYKKGDGGC